MKEIAKSFFESHPSQKECFITSDGFVFVDTHSANSHAASLKDKEVSYFNKIKAEESFSEEGLVSEPAALKINLGEDFQSEEGLVEDIHLKEESEITSKKNEKFKKR